MRLSDIKGDRTLEVIAEVIDPICNIAEDDEAMSMVPAGEAAGRHGAEEVPAGPARKSLPVLLKHHKGDIIAILSSIDGVSPERYQGALNLVKLFKDSHRPVDGRGIC